MLTSDVDDTSGQCSETETETEFKGAKKTNKQFNCTLFYKMIVIDCKQSVSEIAPDGSSKALSNLLLDETKAIMSSMSSTTSSDSRATLHEGNLIEADDSNAISPLERQRAPYSAGPLGKVLR